MVISAWIYTLIPAAAAIIGATVAVNVRPGPTLVSAIQHFAAGVVFAAAAGEILPDIMHRASPWATMIGGGIGGLTAAIALARRGWRAEVFEQAPELHEIGAGLMVATNAMRVLGNGTWLRSRLPSLMVGIEEGTGSAFDSGKLRVC